MNVKRQIVIFAVVIGLAAIPAIGVGVQRGNGTNRTSSGHQVERPACHASAL